MGTVGGLPGVDNAESERVILHVDNDCFYAACERKRDPDLRGKPVIVGMGFEPGSAGGAVATASYEAREYGVESAQPISEAIERLPPTTNPPPEYDGPTGHYRSVDIEFYKGQATRVKSILAEYAEAMREVSIDEAYLDCTDRTSWEHAKTFAAEIQERIAADLNLPVSIGVAPNMAVAKIASDHDKPEGLVVVPPDTVQSFLRPLPIESLHGIGPKTAARLRDNSVEDIGDLATTDPDWLGKRFGERGWELYRRANGIDRRAVEPRGDPKSLSRESAFEEPVSSWDEIEQSVIELAEAVAARASERGATYRTIGIKVVEPPFSINTRERSLPGPVDDPAIVVSISCELLEEFAETTVRKIGVRVSNLSFAAGEQVDLDTWDSSRTVSSDPNRKPTQYSNRGQLSLGAFSGDQNEIG